MSTSRREFLLRALALGGAAATAQGLPGCARRLDPAPIADVPPPTDGKLTLNVNLYPDLQRVGGALTARAQGLANPLLVTRLSGDTFSVLSAVCTHAGCPLGFVPEDGEVECPCHGSRFDPRTGQVTHPPAQQGLPVYAADYDATVGLLTIDLLAGDPGFPGVVGGKVVFPLSDYPQLAAPGGTVVGVPGGLGRPLLVIALSDGSYSAVDATCTHLGCQVQYVQSAGDLECPCHGSTFTVKGLVTHGPALSSLTAFAVAREGDAVTVQVQ